ncbi:MAG: hypothetical protein M1837_000097 [Sclerophora amabilis]|nr:MAG: hypothetical protein M1837_000097 [Sclerophora amabilis]
MAGDELDVGQLSENEQLALQQFTSVTDQGLDAAIPLLRRSQWNVQIAIAKFFDGESADPIAEAQASYPPPRQSTQRETLLDGSSSFASRPSPSGRDIDPAPRIVPQADSNVTRQPSSILTLLFAPFNLLYRLISSSLGLFSYLFPFLPRLISSLSHNARIQRRTGLSRSTTGRRPLNPRDTAARFSREFEEEYGSHQLPFFEDGYAQAHDLAKKELKFLLTVLLSPEHDDTSSFVQDTLLSPDVVEYIRSPENNIILWAGSVQDSEAYQVSASLKCNKFPFAALVAHTPQASASAMSTIVRIAGPTPPAAFLTKLRETITNYSEPLERARATRASHQAERNLREEQNSAYERSLAQDRERARQKREAEAAKARVEQEEKLKLETETREARNLLRWKKWRLRSLPAEPSSPEEVKEATRISVRMPSGERVVRKFAAQAPIEELYAFVECYDVLHTDAGNPDAEKAGSNGGEDVEATGDNDADSLRPDGFEHKYGFRLVSPMPRTVYEPDEEGSVSERIGRSGNLIVEAVDEDEDDEGVDEA